MASRTYSDRSHSAFIYRYAKAAGISQRSAQRHRRENAPGWTRFVETLKSQTPSPIPPAPPPDADEVGMIAAADVTPATMPDALLSMWHTTLRQWWQAVARGDVMAQTDLDGALRQIAKGWRSACRDRERHQKFIDSHVPASEVAALLKGFFEPLKTALETMPAECAPLVNPGNPAAGRAGCLEWLDSRMAPAIDRALERLADYAVAI